MARRYENGQLVGEPDILEPFEKWLREMDATMQRLWDKAEGDRRDGRFDLYLNGRVDAFKDVMLAWERRNKQPPLAVILAERTHTQEEQTDEGHQHTNSG